MGIDTPSGRGPLSLRESLGARRAPPEGPVQTEPKVEHAAPAPKPKEKEEPPLPTGAEALTKLTNYNAAIVSRFKEVRGLFTEGDAKEIDPTKHSDFRGFIQSQLSLVNMRYVLFGHFNDSATMDDGPADPLSKTADALRKQGFAVSGDDVSPEQKALLDKVDPALRANPAAQLAMAAGFDPTKDVEEEQDTPQSAPVTDD